MIPCFDVFFAENKFTGERCVVKLVKDFKSRPYEFKECIKRQLTNSLNLQ